MRYFIAVLIPDKVGWGVVFPDLPGCATQGATLDEALAMASEALAGHVASMVHHGDKLPPARTLDLIKADKSFMKEFDVRWGEAMAAPVALRPPLGRPERVTVSLDSNFLAALDAFAEKHELTRSAALTAGGEILMQLDPVSVSRPERPKRAGKPA